MDMEPRILTHTFQLGMTASLGQLGRQFGGVTEPLLVWPTWPFLRLAACAVEWVQQGGPLREKGPPQWR